MSDRSSSSKCVFTNRPFINILKKYPLSDWKKVFNDGKFTSHKDPHLKSTVHLLNGSTPGNNYILLPKSSHEDLILTGRYFYLNIFADSSKNFSVDIFCKLSQNSSVKISISNEYSDFKASSLSCEVPIIFWSQKDINVDERALHSLLILIEDIPQWTTLCLDLDLLADLIFSGRHVHIKSLKLCGEITFSGMFSSDYLFVPEHLLSEIATPLCYCLPFAMTFPAERGRQWKDLYKFICFPQNICTKPDCKHGKQRNRAESGNAQKNDGQVQKSSLRDDPEQSLSSSPFDGRGNMPPPLLHLEKVLGFGGSNGKYAFMDKSAMKVIYPCNALLVVHEVSNGVQQFMMGHTDKISCLAVDRDFELLASAQTGLNGLVRIWSIETLQPLAMFQPTGLSVLSMSFSRSGQRLCYVGKDACFKNVVTVLDMSKVRGEGEVKTLCKGRTDVQITKMVMMMMIIDTRSEERMISCGHGNIRTWRVKEGRLKSTPLNLGDRHTESFTDLVFESEAEPSEYTDKTPESSFAVVYAMTKSSLLFEVDCIKNAVIRIVDLRKVPSTCSIDVTPSSLLVTQNYLCFGSIEGVLRILARDMTAKFFETSLQGSIEVMRSSNDCTKILVGRSEGRLGIYDLNIRQMTHIQSSLGGKIMRLSLDTKRPNICSISEDGSIRIWNLFDMSQPLSILPPNTDDFPTACAIHPSLDIVLVGFTSGILRAYQTDSFALFMSTARFHDSPLTALAFDREGLRLYTLSATSGRLVVHEINVMDEGGENHWVDKSFQKGQMIPLKVIFKHVVTLDDVVAAITSQAQTASALCISFDGSMLAHIGPGLDHVSVRDSSTLHEVRKIKMSRLMEACDWRIVSTCWQVIFAGRSSTCLHVQSGNGTIYTYDYLEDVVLSKIENRTSPNFTSLMATIEGSDSLFLACDKVLRVHPTGSSLYQQFIGHSKAISEMMADSSGSTLLTLGDALFVWKFSQENGGSSLSREPADTLPQMKRKISRLNETSLPEKFRELKVAEEHDDFDGYCGGDEDCADVDNEAGISKVTTKIIREGVLESGQEEFAAFYSTVTSSDRINFRRHIAKMKL